MIGIKLDMQPFNDTLNRYIAYSEKEMGDEVNRRAAQIIMTAIQFTPRTPQAKIVRDLGGSQVLQRRLIKSGKRKGLFTKGKRFFRADEAGTGFKIFNWRRRFRPDSLPERLQGVPTGNKKMAGLLTKFINSAKSSAGYIQAGWLPALQEFLQVLGGQRLKSNPASSKARKEFQYIYNNKYARQGGALIAGSDGPVFKAKFINAARGAGDERSGAPDALRRAIAYEQQDMMKYLSDRLSEIGDKAVR